MSDLAIAVASLNQTPIDWNQNIENIRFASIQAQKANADILCLPELALCGYNCEDLFFSKWLAEEALEKLFELLPLSNNLLLNIGLPIRFKDKLYNCNAILENGSIKGFVAKQLLANGGVYYEPRWFSPWPDNSVTQIEIKGQKYPIGAFEFEYKGKKVAMEICEDAWHDSLRPGNYYSKNGIDIILNPSASHFALNKTLERQELVRSSSNKYNCTYVYANLVGNDSGRLIFDGELIVAKNGVVMKRNKLLSFSDVNIMIYSGEKEALPPEESDNNYLFPKAVALALFDYLRKSKAGGFVLSLSGGADSSTCAILVAHMVRRGVEAFGHQGFIKKLDAINWELPEDFETLTHDAKSKLLVGNLLHCVFQSSKNSSQSTLNAATYLSESIGAKFSHWSIQEEVDSYSAKIEHLINRELKWETDDIALQNIQARTRSPIIWMLANLKNALLITTSNRSEGDVGYTTMDGDTSGSIAPIAGIAKAFLLDWLKWCEKSLDYHGLKLINELKPTAELRPPDKKQIDEDDLMPYKILWEIEKLAVRDRIAPKDVYEKLKFNPDYPQEQIKSWVIKFFKLWSRNQWKRERLAPSFHLDDFNVDPKTWCRFPILSGGFSQELKSLETLQ